MRKLFTRGGRRVVAVSTAVTLAASAIVMGSAFADSAAPSYNRYIDAGGTLKVPSGTITWEPQTGFTGGTATFQKVDINGTGLPKFIGYSGLVGPTSFALTGVPNGQYNIRVYAVVPTTYTIKAGASGVKVTHRQEGRLPEIQANSILESTTNGTLSVSFLGDNSVDVVAIKVLSKSVASTSTTSTTVKPTGDGGGTTTTTLPTTSTTIAPTTTTVGPTTTTTAKPTTTTTMKPTTTTTAPPSNANCTSPQTLAMDPNDAQKGVTIGNLYLTNDNWNTTSGTSTMNICSAANWTVATNMGGANNTAVLTYPNVHQDFINWDTNAMPAISSFKNITSTFGNTPPSGGGDWEYAYDIWINGVADNNSTELMIWTNNHGQTPSGSKVATFSDGGQTYDVYRSGTYFAFVDQTNVTSGSPNLLNFFNFMISKGYIASTSTLGQIDYGIELCNTGGSTETFGVSNFSLTAQ